MILLVIRERPALKKYPNFWCAQLINSIVSTFVVWLVILLQFVMQATKYNGKQYAYVSILYLLPTIDLSFIVCKAVKMLVCDGKHIIRKLDDEVNFVHKIQRVNNTDFMSQETSTKCQRFSCQAHKVTWHDVYFCCALASEHTKSNCIHICVDLPFYLLCVFIYLIFIHIDTLLRFTYNHFMRISPLGFGFFFDCVLSHVLYKYSIYFEGKIIKCNAYKWNRVLFIISCANLNSVCFIDIPFDSCQICLQK